MLRNTKRHLENFAKRVVKSSRGNLSRKGKNVTQQLKNSIEYELTESNDVISLTFSMLDYGVFQDEGVKGKDPRLADTYHYKYSKSEKKMVKAGIKSKGKQKAPNSRFKFKNKMPPQKPLEKWARFKGIRLRDEKGRFKKGSAKTLGFILQRRIFAQGMKPSLFFTNPFKKAFDNLPEPLLEALGTDLINDIIKRDGKN
jgi:hypothetical protein